MKILFIISPILLAGFVLFWSVSNIFFVEPIANDAFVVFPESDQSLVEGVTPHDQSKTMEARRSFLNDTDTYQWSPEVYVIGEQKNLDSNLYQIFYYRELDYIVVSLQNEVLSIARSEAEKELKASLGYSEPGLCGLDIQVTTPSFISEKYSGQELGLSFCPGHVALE